MTQPDSNGQFGAYGGQYLPPELKQVMDDIAAAYEEIRNDPAFQQELADLQRHYVGRPSPLYFCRRLTEQLGGAEIYLKREDLNHTGAHKINHCLGEALLAKKMGKTKILAETGAGQHGVALSAACALVGIDCEIHMGSIDIAKQAPNVTRMKVMGARLVSVERGTKTLKDAVDSAFEEYLRDPQNFFYAIGSVVGPHPFPQMVRDFQQVVGEEAREQFLTQYECLPDTLIACVGGGSNAMGLFTAFLDDTSVEIIGVEPSGHGLDTPNHAASLTKGQPGVLHGMRCYLLQDDEGEPLPVYSIASGLDYPGVGPQHSHLKDIGRVQYETASDDDCLNAFVTLSRCEGIIPALESAHALAYAMRIAPQRPGKKLLINLSGRGDKDIDFVAERLQL
ncbi:tryptophan synthase subunit beta [Desulfuromonas acetoxidans]|uniref:Tryptophan synthase beta chain n=1 Tax=Desulfuromonas acetoxidans (strain DSM 684 / 11070) TaxID=281689 RepID=Q1K229_DESA6|nr:tryptophan synthase subunit beta [Desulfuromonas acetoxidans]EAT16610.1 tryptophan synthase, beta subunit [Desulfuromonas acetoxidans DSM 684]MBF0644424.1 tryptophan synthase subunit beta [Desulfuromonas acetoxidans]NVD24722.1 tryptophan synthase subunit beta [Desulfuromonas acetoxidans]NVE16767.1 tryptophan synthase subunit beta [Desulfuromonas acetoxidans]